MAVINKSKYNWYPIFSNEFIEAISENYHEDILRQYIDVNGYKDILTTYSCDNFKLKDCLEYLLIESDLQSWAFDWSNCFFYYPMFTMFNWWNKNTYNKLPVDLDGWSQYEYIRSGQEDKQIYLAANKYLHILVANVNNGIGVQINLNDYSIKYYAIGEDDGHWFITTYFWDINNDNINYWKMLIMSEISELHLEEFDHQKVIEQIWNDDILMIYNKTYKW